MDSEQKADYERRFDDLRGDLKKWENDWAGAHDGRKPGREDIKRNPDIAQKYKDYNKIRDILAGKVPPGSESKKRKKAHAPAPVETPRKRAKQTSTPSRPRNSLDEGLMSPAISRKLFSPAPVTTLGPTPQRDGHVLGLFDLLVEKELGTPSKPASQSLGVQATPSKRMGSGRGEEKLSRTPMSASKRQMLDHFMTPLKKRSQNPTAATPSSVTKLQFDTPAFLKRHSMPALDENGDFSTVAPLRLPRKPMVRGLSEIVASLRETEREELDEELDAMLEMEQEMTRTSKPRNEDVEVGDSQPKGLLGGFDDEGLYDSPVEDEVRRDGQPLRVYKKKGQKRTTRRVNMRPTRTKRPTDVEDGDGGSEDEVIPETQPTIAIAGDEQADAGSGSDFEDGNAPTSRDRKGTASQRKPATKENVVKKTVKKVSAMAHANFKRLKLRNHGAKGGPGFNSKFRRRR
ncbi:hypothetical protein S7711_04273 [Stachybotrys chartarum IBT 7711]|uniref:DNA replication regulator SLD2 n=1 Tax=Stachybotrys chartarum (strain CBS 109288 / IBT 7711) TaxID=1280523 RepID=A0A084AJ97_STACB|nr:hypothetical protein S7711_04273 [Stachybotrys chartarum IBT 7711]KFA51163.1 hypothetical protein S40293_04739 [Stachybotrys chartarum IBT 40293]